MKISNEQDVYVNKNYTSMILFTLWLMTIQSHISNSSIIVKCKTCNDDQIGIYEFSTLSQRKDTLYLGNFDSTGIAHISLPGGDSTRLLLEVNRKDSVRIFATSIYLEPNKSIEISYEEGKLNYGGDLGLVNKYISESDGLYSSVVEFHNREYHKLLSDEKKQLYFNGIEKYYSEINSKIKNDSLLSLYERNLLLSYNSFFSSMRQIDLNDLGLLTGENYDLTVKRWKLDGNKGNYYANDFFKAFSINPLFLKIYPSQYAHGVLRDLNVKLVAPIRHHFEWNGLDANKIYEYTKSAILANQRISKYQELILALYTYKYLSFSEDREEIIAIIDNFKKLYPNSKFTGDLELILVKFDVMHPGKMAPELVFNDIKGRELKLSNFKGKYVYIDVWATWCGPCIAEFKYSKKLHDRFRNNDRLIFLYLSVDENINAWKKFIKENKELVGTHVIAVKNGQNITKTLNAHGIPHYVLIGDNGEIIQNYFSRPSQLVDSDELEKIVMGIK